MNNPVMKPISSIKGITKAMFFEGHIKVLFPILAYTSLKLISSLYPRGVFVTSFIIARLNYKATIKILK